MNKKNIELSQWSIEYPYEWEIVCGTRETGPQNNYKIMLLLEKAGFQELSYMISCRLNCLLNDENKINIE